MIRVPQVRVVDEDGSQLGVMPTPQALTMAQDRGLDLVEVAPTAAPPVVRFLDFGQYKYELTKREKEVVALAARGRTSKFIACELDISRQRVSSLLSHAMRKLGVRTQAQLVLKMKAFGTVASASEEGAARARS